MSPLPHLAPGRLFCACGVASLAAGVRRAGLEAVASEAWNPGKLAAAGAILHEGSKHSADKPHGAHVAASPQVASAAGASAWRVQQVTKLSAHGPQVSHVHTALPTASISGPAPWQFPTRTQLRSLGLLGDVSDHVSSLSDVEEFDKGPFGYVLKAKMRTPSADSGPPFLESWHVTEMLRQGMHPASRAAFRDVPGIATFYREVKVNTISTTPWPDEVEESESGENKDDDQNEDKEKEEELYCVLQPVVGNLADLVLGKSFAEVPLRTRIRLFAQVVQGAVDMDRLHASRHTWDPDNIWIVGDGDSHSHWSAVLCDADGACSFPGRLQAFDGHQTTVWGSPDVFRLGRLLEEMLLESSTVHELARQEAALAPEEALRASEAFMSENGDFDETKRREIVELATWMVETDPSHRIAIAEVLSFLTRKSHEWKLDLAPRERPPPLDQLVPGPPRQWETFMRQRIPREFGHV